MKIFNSYTIRRLENLIKKQVVRLDFKHHAYGLAA